MVDFNHRRVKITAQTKEHMMFNFADLTDDLTVNQFQDLIQYLFTGQFRVSRASIRGWRRLRGLPIDQEGVDIPAYGSMVVKPLAAA